MPSISSTHMSIASPRPPGRYRIEGQQGLYLRIRASASGATSRTWLYRSDAGGVTRYKTLKAEKFAEAKVEADDLRKASTEGVNEIDAMRQTKRAAQEAAAAAVARVEAERIELEQADALRPTVATIAKKYLGVFVAEKRRAQGKKRSAPEDKRIYERHVGPALGLSKLDSLRTKHIAAMRDAIESDSEQRKAIALIRALLSQAMSDGLIESNPALGIKSTPSAARTRVLTDAEIRALWNVQKVDGVRPPMIAAIKVQLLTAQRAGEVLAMRWADVDQNALTWTIPKEVAKNGRQHVVPLVPECWALIDSQERVADLVFPPHRAKGRSSTAAYGLVVQRVREALNVELREAGGVELGEFTSHDLRRTAATRMAGLGVLPHVIEAVLNHSSGIVSGIAAVYNLESYLAEKRAALNSWSGLLESYSNARG